MTMTIIQRVFAPLRNYFPGWILGPIRSIGTAFLAPILFSYRTGHFKSSFKNMAVSKDGEPLPWYTYPCIDFLKYRDYSDKTVLEFGGGQSTLWWAKRAKHVVTIEGNKEWYERIRDGLPENVDLHYVVMDSAESCLSVVKKIVDASYDAIIIDGHYRFEMAGLAQTLLSESGIIVCDDTDAECYRYADAFKETDLKRVDFFGNAPGVVLTRATSIFFKPNSFVFSPKYAVPAIARE